VVDIENKWRWNQFGDLRTCAHLEEYLQGQEYRHGGYFHYTRLDTVDKILSGKTFWLSNVGGFNDMFDQQQFSKKMQFFFSLCFSTGENENLPLWYLYSGIDGQGGRIRLTKSGVQTLIKKGTYRLVCTEHPNEFMILEQGKTMDVEFRDVIYAHEAKGKNLCDLKYNTMTNHWFPKEDFIQYKEKHNGFCKGLIWYYEKESRLLVRIKGDAETLLRKWMKSDIAETSPCRVELSFDENLMKKMTVTLAPNISREKMGEMLKNKTGIQELISLTSAVQPSGYAGSVKFDLCKGCQQNKEVHT